MSERREALAGQIAARLGDRLSRVPSTCDELTYELERDHLIEVATLLRDEEDFRFAQLIDLCGVDYLTFGHAEWRTNAATDSGFSRAAVRETIVPDPAADYEPRRFAVVYHLLSVAHNQRLRLRVFTGTGSRPWCRP